MTFQDEKVASSNSAFLKWFGFDRFVPETAVTSHWVSSKVFFAIRFTLALYSTIVQWTNIGYTAAEGDFSSYFAFFTNLTFVGLHSYLITSTVHHIRYLRNKNMNFMLNQPAFLNYLYVYLYCTVITFNIVTPVVYWSLLASNLSSMNTVRSWLNASVHASSFFLMIIDVIFNRMKVPIRMIIFVLITVVFYMFLAFIVHASKGYWVYPFLDWNQGGKAAIWYVAVALIVTASFFLQVLIHYVRDLIARKAGKSVSAGQFNEKVESIDTNRQPDMTKLDTRQSSVV